MPTEDQYKEHDKAMYYWGMRRRFEAPLNYVRKQMRAYNEKASSSPLQVSQTGKTYTLFGEAFKVAISGEVSSRQTPYCTIKAVFSHMLTYMTEKCTALEITRHEEEIRRLRGDVDGFGEGGNKDDNSSIGVDDASAKSGEDDLSTATKRQKAKKDKKKEKKKNKKKKIVTVFVEPELQKISQVKISTLSIHFPLCSQIKYTSSRNDSRPRFYSSRMLLWRPRANSPSVFDADLQHNRRDHL